MRHQETSRQRVLHCSWATWLPTVMYNSNAPVQTRGTQEIMGTSPLPSTIINSLHCSVTSPNGLNAINNTDESTPQCYDHSPPPMHQSVLLHTPTTSADSLMMVIVTLVHLFQFSAVAMAVGSQTHWFLSVFVFEELALFSSYASPSVTVNASMSLAANVGCIYMNMP